MSKTAVILLGVVILATAPQAFAGELDFTKLNGQYPYKALPGVEAFGTNANDESQFKCKTATRQYRFNDEDSHLLLSDNSLPVLVYRCTDGVITLESTRTPYPSTKRPK